MANDRDCESCKHYKKEVCKNGIFYHSCELWDCEFEPKEDVEPKTGHWIEVTNGRGGHECDICHRYAPSYQDGDEYLTNYCPNCGAKMESEDQG